MIACIVENNKVINIIEVPNEEMMNKLNIGAVYLGDYPVIGDNVIDGIIPEMEERSKSNLTSIIRIERNRLLSECDWTQLPDSGLTDEKKASWSKYRQELRDMPQQKDFPENITYPEMPI